MKTILITLLLAGCSSAPPGTYSAGFMGAQIQYSTPGWSGPVPVVQSAAIIKPTLLVPADSPAATSLSAKASDGSAVPVVVAPVAAPVLAVPATK